MNKVKIAQWEALEPVTPTYALVGNVDLVVVKWEDGSDVSVLYGRCAHRGALMADATIRGEDIVCGVHNWDYRYKTGVSAYNNAETLHKFTAWVESVNANGTVRMCISETFRGSPNHDANANFHWWIRDVR